MFAAAQADEKLIAKNRQLKTPHAAGRSIRSGAAIESAGEREADSADEKGGTLTPKKEF